MQAQLLILINKKESVFFKLTICTFRKSFFCCMNCIFEDICCIFWLIFYLTRLRNSLLLCRLQYQPRTDASIDPSIQWATRSGEVRTHARTGTHSHRRTHPRTGPPPSVAIATRGKAFYVHPPLLGRRHSDAVRPHCVAADDSRASTRRPAGSPNRSTSFL